MTAFLTILSLIAVLVGLAAGGLMTAETTAGLLVAVVILLALGRTIGTGLGAAVFWVGLPLLSIVALAVHHSGGSRDAERLVRVEQDDVPILASPDYAAPTLELIGVASMGEHFAVVDDKTVGSLFHLLSGAPDQSGLWYKVRLLDGNEGWILAQPRGRQGKPIATSFPVGGDPAGLELVRDLAPDRAERNAAQYVLDRFARLIRSAFWTLVFAAGIAGVLGGAWMTRSFWRDRVRRRLGFRRPCRRT